ncbi:MAG: SUMF1/EgtB/PvdO family nonheme iron enzyme, partial [Phaeodactylibacter sp.]|nr:SUMF1/EgtB/PvdO family nonheme iron enzyme [Phaeodactylibacter sp.]
GLLLPNEVGLYDMSGNVYEWCADVYNSSYSEAPADGSVWDRPDSKGANRVYRGGGWASGARHCRVSYRPDWRPDVRDPDVGFRVALSLQSVG